MLVVMFIKYCIKVADVSLLPQIERLQECRFGRRKVIFLSSASQGSYGGERDLVRKWLPAIFNRLLLEPGRHW